ncbi:TPA: hypothetical protein DEG21_05075 [Patescibacteria group bacterium]|nr:hypothetical protein [Candidatus Gracilibacteria bacterium]HBY75203.1 hypothetical protein [Candidatus Gracilibacteria bacterium]
MILIGLSRLEKLFSTVKYQILKKFQVQETRALSTLSQLLYLRKFVSRIFFTSSICSLAILAAIISFFEVIEELMA